MKSKAEIMEKLKSLKKSSDFFWKINEPALAEPYDLQIKLIEWLCEEEEIWVNN